MLFRSKNLGVKQLDLIVNTCIVPRQIQKQCFRNQFRPQGFDLLLKQKKSSQFSLSLIQQIMDSSIAKKIDAAFEQGKEEGMVNLYQKGMQDAQFICLLTKETQKVINLNLGWNKMSSLLILRMKDGKWDSLTNLGLQLNRIGDKGCQYLSSASIPLLKEIDLNNNRFSSLGVSHLSKAQWKILQRIFLHGNRIGVDGAKEISKAGWQRTLITMFLPRNELTVRQAQQLILWDMPSTDQISVFDNRIEKWSKDDLRYVLKKKFVSAGYCMTV